mmetsp:Transcript_141060/g.358430  ORF Transcript_141060/g.358430 Transcript_141060/m.358430 type:complete len:247 (+) Transcript_141060:674-1414(+)
MGRQHDQLIGVVDGKLVTFVHRPHEQHPRRAGRAVSVHRTVRRTRVVEHAEPSEEKHGLLLQRLRHRRLEAVVVRGEESLGRLRGAETLDAAEPAGCPLGAVLAILFVTRPCPEFHLSAHRHAQDVSRCDAREVVVFRVEDEGLLDEQEPAGLEALGGEVAAALGAAAVLEDHALLVKELRRHLAPPARPEHGLARRLVHEDGQSLRTEELTLAGSFDGCSLGIDLAEHKGRQPRHPQPSCGVSST